MRRWLPDETMTADEVWKLPESVHHFFSHRAANFLAQEQICVMMSILNANQRSSSYSKMSSSRSDAASGRCERHLH